MEPPPAADAPRRSNPALGLAAIFAGAAHRKRAAIGQSTDAAAGGADGNAGGDAGGAIPDAAMWLLDRYRLQFLGG